MISDKTIYLDWAATTPLCEEAASAMAPFLCGGAANLELGGNANSLHSVGRRAFSAMEQAREGLSRCIGCRPDELFFTSGATEADNTALFGIVSAVKRKKALAGDAAFTPHIITTSIEHEAVLAPAHLLERMGVQLTVLKPDRAGFVSARQVEEALRPNTVLVSVMLANNEVGSVQPLEEIVGVAHAVGVLVHTDAVQALGKIPIDLHSLGVDAASFSAHKICGPKGIGFLYIRKGVKIRSFVHGGAQERKRRAGTENVPGIVGYGQAALEAVSTMEERTKKEIELRDYLIDRMLKEIPYSRLNGHRTKRLPNNANFSFQFIEGESLLIMLDMEGICGSSGSACTSGSLDPSHVLMAIGLPHEIAHGSLRLTLGADTTKEDIDFTVEKTKAIVERLRSMSPLYEDFVKKSERK